MTAPPMTMACSGADPADDRARARTAAGRAAMTIWYDYMTICPKTRCETHSSQCDIGGFP